MYCTVLYCIVFLTKQNIIWKTVLSGNYAIFIISYTTIIIIIITTIITIIIIIIIRNNSNNTNNNKKKKNFERHIPRHP